MTSIASGGLPGLGAGEGNLSDVGAASTDLVFGMLSEEWGLVIAILAVLCIVTMGVFAYRSIIAGRSTYYCIAACAATSMFMFQTILNVFGSIDLLPLTGVTFPFVSSGGTSMIASWGMLAFLKAADTRQNASIAVRSKEFISEDDIYTESMSSAEYEEARQFFKELEQDGFNDDFLTDQHPHKSQPEDYAQPEPYLVPGPDLYVKPEPRPVVKPKAVKYKEVSDDDFFGKLNPDIGSKSEPTKVDEGPVTLDDIFGDDGIFGGHKK